MQEGRYPHVEIDPFAYNDPYTLAAGLIEPGSTVLDVGTWDGAFPAFLKRYLKCRVFGIEKDEGAAIKAKEICEELVVADVESLDFKEAFSNVRFDYVTFLDVLEHLKEPGEVLGRVKEVLSEKGCVIASIPNVAHAALRLSLLAGRFKYTKNGLLDETHLRFFDRARVEQMFKEAGYDLLSIRRVIRAIDETEVEVDPSGFPEEVVQQALKDEDALTYQFVVLAAVKGARRDDFRLPPLAFFQERLREEEKEKERLESSVEEIVRQAALAEKRTAELQARFEEQRRRAEVLKEALERERTRAAELEQRVAELQARLRPLEILRSTPLWPVLRFLYRALRRMRAGRG